MARSLIKKSRIKDRASRIVLPLSVLAPYPIVPQRIEPRIQILFRSLLANRFYKMSQRESAQPRLISKLWHQFATMPFHPADLIGGELTLPPRHRLGTNLRKTDSGGRVASPEPARLRRR